MINDDGRLLNSLFQTHFTPELFIFLGMGGQHRGGVDGESETESSSGFIIHHGSTIINAKKSRAYPSSSLTIIVIQIILIITILTL